MPSVKNRSDCRCQDLAGIHKWYGRKWHRPFWLREEERALRKGYQGLRSAVDTSFLYTDDWDGLMDYEGAVATRSGTVEF